MARLFVALRRLRDRGVGIIYVSHRLDEVFEIADRMVVRDGRVAGERWVDQTTPEDVILLIVGREPSQVFRRPARRIGQPRMALQSVAVGEIGPIDCELHAGEVVGFVGLRGAGQETIGRALFGTVPTTGGRILLDGKPVAPATPRQAMANGINLVCADRAGESLAPNLTIREEIFLNPLAAGLRLLSLLSPGRENRAAMGSASGSDCGRTIRSCPSSFCPAAINRRSWSVAGCIWPARFTSSRIRPPVSMSARRRRFTGSLTPP